MSARQSISDSALSANGRAESRPAAHAAPRFRPTSAATRRNVLSSVMVGGNPCSARSRRIRSTNTATSVAAFTTHHQLCGDPA